MEKLNAAIEQLEAFKRKHGRYTIEEAATFIHEKTGEPCEGMKSQLNAAVKDGELQTYSPDSFTKNYSKITRDFYEHVYWNKLNDWLKKNKPHVDCEFPDPNFPDKKFYTDEANRNGGRYQLGLAAMIIASSAKAEVNSMMHKLFEAAGAGELRVYERGMDEVYRFTTAPNWKSNPQLKDNEIKLEAKWNDLNAWLKDKERGIFDAYNFPEPDAPAAKVKAVVDTTRAQVTQNKLRRNNLDPAIDKAIKQAENKELADVYLKLKELALSGEMPFTGALDGDALCYTNDNNKPSKLTKDALGKRLKKRRSTPPAAVSG